VPILLFAFGVHVVSLLPFLMLLLALGVCVLMDNCLSSILILVRMIFQVVLVE